MGSSAQVWRCFGGVSGVQAGLGACGDHVCVPLCNHCVRAHNSVGGDREYGAADGR